MAMTDLRLSGRQLACLLFWACAMPALVASVKRAANGFLVARAIAVVARGDVSSCR